MKQWVAIAVGVALVVDVTLFLGLGASAGAPLITAASGSPPPGNQYNPQPFCVYEGLVCYEVNFTNVWAGAPLITSLEAGQLSSPLSFGVNTWIAPGSCTPGNEREDAWNGGVTNTATSSFYVIHFSGYGSNIPTGTVNGKPYTGGTWAVSVNSSVAQGVILSYCLNSANALGQESSAVYSTPGLQFSQTLQLVGIYPDMQVSVAFESIGQYCDGSPTSLTASGACLAAFNNAGGVANNVYSKNNGGWTGVATTTAVYRSAGASFSLIGQPYVNGGTLTVAVTTGYDDGGYRLVIDCPQPRACGGSPDTSFTPNPVSVPDDALGYLVTWKIPANAAQNNSVGPAWNDWTIVLYTQFAAGQLTQVAIISPLYSPATPGVTMTNSGPGLYPFAGDTVDVTIWANASQQSGPATTVVLAVYYQSPGNPWNAEPGCGSGWVSGIPCPGGLNLTVTNGKAMFSFVVNAPPGATQIGVTVYSGAANGQASPTFYTGTQISPVGTCGPASNPCKTSLSLWAEVGPILLLLMPILAMILGLVIVPVMNVRLLLGAGIAVTIVLGALFFGSLETAFGVGGLLGPAGPSLG